MDAAHVIGQDNHLTTANEGSAIALAIGHHLATRELAAVYMQNSGLGNAINPLVSLASSEVYSIPMLLVIGWRGMPGTSDEPQHVLQGRITESLLDCIGIPYQEVCESEELVEDQVRTLVDLAKRTSAPVALLIPKGSLDSNQKPERTANPSLMSREAGLQVVLKQVEADTRIISSTGMLSRELYENTDGLKSVSGFMTVGGMGHAASIALGVAQEVDECVVCLDGDGAALMHLGAMVTIGREAPDNLIHIVLNNGVHDSVGGQLTTGPDFEFARFASMCRYSFAIRVSSPSELARALDSAQGNTGVSFIEIMVNPGNRPGIGRPRESMSVLKARIMAS